MNPAPSTPTGHVETTAEGRDLVLVRTFRAPVEDVWAAVTEPGRSARWFGPWSGDGRVGGEIDVTWAAEEGQPVGRARIEACEPPVRLRLTWHEPDAGWDTEVRLSELDGVTELTFVHHLADGLPASGVGSGWEWYLDRLVAAQAGEPLPVWDEDYQRLDPAYAAMEPTTP